ncbi:MAG: hypothetical protein IPI55_00395 [Flavobacteriales bacterium]|nr:hypothetical protein [Flavobacteriales bacterium]
MKSKFMGKPMTRMALGLVAAFLGCALCAQPRNANVIFGDNLWLNFNGGALAVSGSPYSPTNRTACISNTNGELLFLADETGIRDTTFALMAGGDATTLGWPNTLAAVLILPKPGSSTNYIVFVNTPETTKQAGWVEVDMSLSGGLGGVVSTGTTWYMSNCTAKLAATTHSNGTDYWVMQHADGTDEFHAYRLAVNGLGPAPVISAAGSSLTPTPFPERLSSDFWSPMKFSPMGDRLAMGLQLDGDTLGASVLHFDQTTGIVSHVADIPAQFITTPATVDRSLLQRRPRERY